MQTEIYQKVHQHGNIICLPNAPPLPPVGLGILEHGGPFMPPCAIKVSSLSRKRFPCPPTTLTQMSDLTISQIIEQLHELQDYVSSVMIVTAFDVVGSALYIYDYFLTLDLEVELVWPSKWGAMKVLFLVQRYLPFLDTVSLCLVHQLAADISPSTCYFLYSFRGYLIITGFLLSEVILTLRAWAVWKRERILGYNLLFFIVATYAGCTAVMALFLKDLKLSPKPYPEFPGCFVSGANHILYLCWVILTAFEAGIMVLMIVAGISAYRIGGDAGLRNVIYREGILTYIYLFALSIINVAVVNTLPINYVNLLAAVERVLHSMLASRVLLHIRAVMSKERVPWSDGLTEIQIPNRSAGVVFNQRPSGEGIKQYNTPDFSFSTVSA